MMPGFSGPSLVVGSGRGVRSWSLNSDGWLVGNYGTIWREATFEAVCGAVTTETGQVTGRCLCGNPIPCRHCSKAAGDGKCGCGIWAYWQHQGMYGITGVIEATGRTITGPCGLRTARAKILGLTTEGCHPNVPWTVQYLAAEGVPVLTIWGTRIPLSPGMPDTPPLDLLLNLRYPGVPLYPTVTELLAAHPTTPELHLPGPEPSAEAGTVVTGKSSGHGIWHSLLSAATVSGNHGTFTLITHNNDILYLR